MPLMNLRTRVYDSMTNAEVTSYLARNDVVFLPVGTAEMHGSMPLGCDNKVFISPPFIVPQWASRPAICRDSG